MKMATHRMARTFLLVGFRASGASRPVYFITAARLRLGCGIEHRMKGSVSISCKHCGELTGQAELFHKF